MTTNPSSASALNAAESTAVSRSVLATIAREAGLVVAGTVALSLLAQIALPLPFTPVPVTLGTFAALGIGGLLGSRRAFGSVALYAGAAALGAPVLAGWSGGIGASFGYVMGYAVAAVAAGRATACAADGSRRPIPARIGLMLLASALVYVPGLSWLKLATGATWSTVVALGAAPFIIGDILKSVAAAMVFSRPASLR